MKYEDFLKEVEVFQNPEASLADRTEKTLVVLDTYKEKLEKLTEAEQLLEKQKKQIEDLTHAQSLMYRRLGAEAETALEQPTVEKKMITLEDIERGNV